MVSCGPWGWDTPEVIEPVSLQTLGQGQPRTLLSDIPAAMGTEGYGGR